MKTILKLIGHTVWFLYGVIFLLINATAKELLFSQYANLEVGFWKYTLLGATVPVGLWLLAIWGVLSVILIPSTIFYKPIITTILFWIIAGISTITLFIGVFTENGEVWQKILVFVILMIPVCVILAPFFLYWEDLVESEAKDRCMIGLCFETFLKWAAIILGGAMLLGFVISLIFYWSQAHSVSFTIVLLIILLGFGSTGSVYYVFVVRKN